MKHFFKQSILMTLVRQNSPFYKKSQINTAWHWLLLFLFGLLVYGENYQKLLLLGAFISISVLIKGPLMLLWAGIYSTFIAFFPPIGILLSLLFLIINFGTTIKSWRSTLVSAYFYLIPLLGVLFQKIIKNEPQYLLFLFVTLSILGLHFLLDWLYQHNNSSRSLTWHIICLPYSLLLFLLPTRFHCLKETKKKSIDSL